MNALAAHVLEPDAVLPPRRLSRAHDRTLVLHALSHGTWASASDVRVHSALPAAVVRTELDEFVRVGRVERHPDVPTLFRARGAQ